MLASPNSVVGVAVVTVYEPASIKKFITARCPFSI